MSDLEKLQQNLNYKIKAQEIGLEATRKVSKKKPEPMKPLTKDYLLNSASKLQDLNEARNKMIEEYLDEQATPVIRIDPETGEEKKYKFHGVIPPDLEFESVDLTYYNPSSDEVVYETLDVDQQREFLLNKNQFIQDLQNDLSTKIKRKEDLINELNMDIKDKDNEISDLKFDLENININLDQDVIRREKARFKRAIGRLNYEIKNIRRGIDNEKNEINDLARRREEVVDDIEEAAAKINIQRDKNAAKLKTYQQELTNLNRGQLNTEKRFDETDEEYLTRLNELADTPFVDERTQQKALIRQKDKLRDNLKLIIRDNALIAQVVNFLFINEPLIIPEINKYFKGFQEYYSKKFTSDSKISFNEVIREMTFYLKRATDTKILSGNVPPSASEIAEEILRTQPQEISSSIATFSTVPELISQLESELGKESDLIHNFDPEMKAIIEAQEATIRPPIYIQYKTLDNDTTLELFNPKKGKKVYIKMYDETDLETKGPKKKFFHAPIFFISETNTQKSFNNIHFKTLVAKIAKILGVTGFEIYKYLGTTMTKATKDLLLKGIENLGLQPTTQMPTENQSGKLGYGIKNDDLHDKVHFGSNILLLKKLFLKNILSLQNKHNTKINGFNNVHVSDNFVKIIMNLLKGINFDNNDLNTLSNNERLLLDNLLIISDLHKKFITGSATDSLSKLKKDYELLIGEVEAGNNNPMIKKKLYTILMKMVHFGAITSNEAKNKYIEILEFLK